MEFSKDIIGKSLVAIIVGFFIFCFLMGVIVKEVPLSLHDVLWTFLCLIPILTILRVFELFNITPKLTGFIGKILHHVGNTILKIILFSAMGIFLILALSVGLYGIFLLFGCMGYCAEKN